MNGGPGASSLIGAFTEMGQLIFNRNSNTAAATPKLFRNPYSCASPASALAAGRCTAHIAKFAHSGTTAANMLYLEAPAGVGYSFCVDPESTCTSNDTSTAIDNHAFLVGFLAAFPKYKARSLFITGESCLPRTII